MNLFFSCVDTKSCAGYEYKGTRPRNCLLIHCLDDEGQIFQQENDDVIYEKGNILFPVLMIMMIALYSVDCHELPVAPYFAHTMGISWQ